jgi:hypothetical protein
MFTYNPFRNVRDERADDAFLCEERVILFEKFYDASAGGYDRAFGRVSRDLVPSLLQGARQRGHSPSIAENVGVVGGSSFNTSTVIRTAKTASEKALTSPSHG